MNKGLLLLCVIAFACNTDEIGKSKTGVDSSDGISLHDAPNPVDSDGRMNRDASNPSGWGGTD